MTSLSDEELVERFRSAPQSSSSEAPLNELFQRYHTRVAAWAYRFSGNRETALDLSQEIFLKAFRHLHGFQGTSKFSTWLYAIARNHCLNHVKSRAAEPAETGEELSLELPSLNMEDPATRMDRESSMRVMRQLMTETLDETEMKVMTLHFADEMPLEAVTRTLGLTNASGAKAYVVSARRKLQTALQRWKAREAKSASGRASERTGE
jgi:RNA polymerase sigma-70 factor (ECF subfamily)